MTLQDTSRRNRWICFGILVLGALLKLLYAWQVPFNVSPHDLGIPTQWGKYSTGHLGYIQYLYWERQLVQVSPEGLGQLYHPPLFHLTGAAVFALVYQEGMPLERVFELVQLLNTVFACLIPVVAYWILRQLEVKGSMLVLLTAFISFGPTLYWLGTALNNDCLMTLLLLVTVALCVRWAKKPGFLTVVLMGLALALAMLTKTSAVLIAPAIACVFLWQLWVRIREKKGIWNLIGQYAAFALVSIPLGMSYVVRNYLKFGTPLNYVLRLPEGLPQYLGGASLWQRVGLFNPFRWSGTGIDWEKPMEHANLWKQTFLTMALDENILNTETRLGQLLGTLLIWCCFVSVLVLVYFAVRNLLTARVSLPMKLFLIAGIGVIFGSYVLFAFQYPHICTMNFRYIYPVLVLLAMACGAKKEKAPLALWITLPLFCLVSVLSYGLYGV